MVRLYRISPWTFFISFVLLFSLLFVSLPVIAALAVILVLGRFIRKIFLGAQKPEGAFHKDGNGSYVSSVIANKKIGPYRIKKNPQDPNVIEVLD